MFVFIFFFVFIAAVILYSCFVSRKNTKVKNHEEEVNKKSGFSEKTVPKEISTGKKKYNTDQVIVAMANGH